MSALGTRSLVVSVAAADSTAQVSDLRVEADDADSAFTSFADAAAGGAKDWFLRGVAVQDLAAASLWRKIWSSAGTTVAVLVKPYGNATASVSQPHYSGNVTIKVPNGVVIGGEADPNTSARFTWEIDWPFDAKPTEITS